MNNNVTETYNTVISTLPNGNRQIIFTFVRHYPNYRIIYTNRRIEDNSGRLISETQTQEVLRN